MTMEQLYEMVSDRIAIGENPAVLDIDIDVTVCNLESIHDLADVDVGDARVRVGVRILADGKRV